MSAAPAQREHAPLPHNLAAEASILGGILIANGTLAKLDALETDDFYDRRHQVVFAAMRNLEARREPIDPVTLENEIAKQGKLDAIGGPAFFGELALQVPTADNVVEYTTLVRSYAQVRRVALAASDILQRAQRWGTEPVDELVAQARREYEELAKRHVEATEPIKLYTVGDALEEQARFAEQPVYPTPFATVNEAIGFGGLLGTQVYTVAAGTGRGKTTFVTELAAHTAASVPVIVASYEMKPGYFVARKAAGVLGVHSNQIIRGEVSMNAVMAAMPYGRLFFMHKPSLRHLRIAIDRLAQRFGVAPLVVVDYLQKLADEIAKKQQRPDLRMATTEASSSLLEIADDTGVAIACVSATGRGKGKLFQTPRKFAPYELVEVSKESGAVEFDGAGIIVLSLSDEYEDDERIATITVAKARFGSEVHIDARYNGRRGTWRDLGVADRVEGAKTPPPPTESNDELRLRIVRFLRDHVAKNKTDLCTRVRGNKKKLGHEYDALLQNGTIEITNGLGVTLSEKGRQTQMEGV